MRSTTNIEQIIESGHFSNHVRAFVKDGSSVFQDVTDYLDHDWLIGCTVSDDADQNMATAKCFLQRSMGGKLSINPMITDALGASLLDFNREIYIEMGIGPHGASSPVEWVQVFRGYITEIDVGENDNPMQISCRDLGAVLMDTFIETQRVYGSEAGTDVRTVMQDILDDNGLSTITLYTPINPSWALKEYRQDKMPILQALSNIAEQLGWIVRYRWDTGTSAWRLTFYSPDRAAATTDFTFSSENYDSISPGLTYKDIRNKIMVVYSDSSTGQSDEPESWERKTVTVSDATSIAKYGTRYMEVVEAVTSQIDTSTEATKMCDNMLLDLKEPTLDQTIKLPFIFPYIDVENYYTFSVNDEHYNADQDLSVFSYELSCDRAGSATTSIRVNGTPTAGRKRWIRKEARPGNGPTADFIGPTKATEITNYTRNTAGIAAFSSPPRSDPTLGVIANLDFGQHSRVFKGSGWPPDNWIADAGTWGDSDDLFVSETVSRSGGRSLHFLNSATTPKIMKTKAFPVHEGDLYTGFAWIRTSSSDVTDVHIYSVKYFQADGTTQVGSTATLFTGRISGSPFPTWKQTTFNYSLVPSGAVLARLYLEQQVSTAHNMWVDHVVFKRSLVPSRIYQNSSQNVGPGATVVEFDTVLEDPASWADLANYRVEIKKPGKYRIYAGVRMTGLTDNKTATIHLNILNPTAAALQRGDDNTNSGGTAFPKIAWEGTIQKSLSSSTHVYVTAEHTDSGAVPTSAVFTDTYLYVVQTETF